MSTQSPLTFLKNGAELHTGNIFGRRLWDSSLFRVFLSCGALAILLTGQSAPASAATITVEYRLADGGGAGLLLDAIRLLSEPSIRSIKSMGEFAMESRSTRGPPTRTTTICSIQATPYVDHLGLAYTLKQGSSNVFAFFYDDGEDAAGSVCLSWAWTSRVLRDRPRSGFHYRSWTPIDKVTAITDFEVNFNIWEHNPRTVDMDLHRRGIWWRSAASTAHRRSSNAIF